MSSKIKDTDAYYLGKRNIPVEYDPTGSYAFPEWKNRLGEQIEYNYEHLHEQLLYLMKSRISDKLLQYSRKLIHCFVLSESKNDRGSRCFVNPGRYL